MLFFIQLSIPLKEWKVSTEKKFILLIVSDQGQLKGTGAQGPDRDISLENNVIKWQFIVWKSLSCVLSVDF